MRKPHVTENQPASPLRVGTRGSQLAVTQTGLVATQLAEWLDRPLETVRVRTDGDVLTGSLSSLGGTGVFVVALRQAMLAGRCDLAVHSLKDLPAEPADGLTMVYPEREDPRDAFCARPGVTLASLPQGARVGTGSPRRAAQVRALRPDLDVVDIRGNVDTRLARALGPDADLDGVVLAYAGLARLGRGDAVRDMLDPSVMMPAPGQGALAVELRTDELTDASLAAALARLDHEPTRLAVTAERAVLAGLSAGCAAPVGAHATLAGDTLTLDAVVISLDGTQRLARRAQATLPPGAEASSQREDAAHRLGLQMAETLLAAGARGIAPLSESGSRAEKPQ